MQEFDYIIVGAGSSGCALASRLSEDPATRVCLIEAGPRGDSMWTRLPLGLVKLVPTKGPYNWAFETVPQPGLGGRRGFQPRGRGLGGSSLINAMVYTRGHPADYDEWAALGNPGWSYADVLPYFRKSESNERGEDAFHGGSGPLAIADLRDANPASLAFVAAAEQAGYARNTDFSGERQEGFGLYQVNQVNGRRCSAAKAYLEPAAGRDNLAILTDAHVTRVLLEGGEAVGVALIRGGTPERLRARREVIVCAGAFQSPQLLMLSGIGTGAELQKHDIGVRHDLPGVGRNLQDHPDYTVIYQYRSAALFGRTPRKLAQILLAIPRYRFAGRGMLTSNASEAGGFYASRPGLARPDLQAHFVIGLSDEHGRKRHLGIYGMTCHVCVLRPASRGSVTLGSRDPLAAPLIDPNFLGAEEDVALMLAGVRATRTIMRQAALDPYRGKELYGEQAQTDAELTELIRSRADTIYHPVGTCKMGKDALAVVDHALRVRGVGRLRVVDASVMPTLIRGNTNAPAMMIAEKAADMIREAARA